MEGVQLVGVLGIAIVLALVTAIALLRRRYDGRLRTAAGAELALPGGSPPNRQANGAAGGARPALSDVGIVLPAEQVTVVQFTGEFCAVCPQARTLVQRVLRDHPDIAHVEVDVADHLDAVRALDIRRTPTLIIVDTHGRPVHRGSGMPREAELRRAVAELAAPQ